VGLGSQLRCSKSIHVRSETAKVTWPSRRETMITSTVMVFIMVGFVLAMFLLRCRPDHGLRLIGLPQAFGR
jgi:uncharacterized membrane protein